MGPSVVWAVKLGASSPIRNAMATTLLFGRVGNPNASAVAAPGVRSGPARAGGDDLERDPEWDVVGFLARGRAQEGGSEVVGEEGESAPDEEQHVRAEVEGLPRRKRRPDRHEHRSGALGRVEEAIVLGRVLA